MEQEQLIHLIKRAQSNDAEAQQELYLDGYKSVYYLALKMLGNEDLAEDAVQEVYISAFTKLPSLQHPEAWYGWLNTIAANKCRNVLRKQNPVLLDNPDEEQFFGEEDNTALLPENALDSEETQKLILAVIDNLPPAQKMCVLYYYYGQLTVLQIAEIMECSEGTVKSRLSAARAKIRLELERIEERDGIRLYAIPLPLFALLSREAANLPVPQSLSGALWRNISFELAKNGASVLAKKAAKQGIKRAVKTTAKKSIAVKVVAVVSAVSLVAAGFFVVPRIWPGASPASSVREPFSYNPEILLNEDELPIVESYSDLFGRIAVNEYGSNDVYTHDCFGFYVTDWMYEFANTYSEEDKRLFESGEPFIDRQVLAVVGTGDYYVEGASFTLRVSRLSDYADLLNIPDANEEDIMQYKYGHLKSGGFYLPWTGIADNGGRLETYEFADNPKRTGDAKAGDRIHEYHGIVINGYYVEFESTYLYDPTYPTIFESYDIFPTFIWHRETPEEKEIYK